MERADSETRSLSPSYKVTIIEHDRLFQKKSLESQIYCVPIDEEEEARLEVQHEIINRLFRFKLFLGDIEYPENVLDCGYGQAQWVIAVAQQYPDCKVTGIDIWPLDLPEEPPNLERLCDDLNQDLAFDPESFDVIQSRFVALGIHKNRWKSYFEELVKLLRHGGSMQVMEYYFNIQSSTGFLNNSHALYQWGEKFREAMSRDRDLRIASGDPRLGGKSRMRRLMEEAGLENVQERHEDLPIGDWPTDQRLKQIGLRNLENIDRALDSYVTWPFIERLGMTKDAVKTLTDRAREELRNPRMKAYIPLSVKNKPSHLTRFMHVADVLSQNCGVGFSAGR